MATGKQDDFSGFVYGSAAKFKVVSRKGIFSASFRKRHPIYFDMMKELVEFELQNMLRSANA